MLYRSLFLSFLLFNLFCDLQVNTRSKLASLPNLCTILVEQERARRKQQANKTHKCACPVDTHAIEHLDSEQRKRSAHCRSQNGIGSKCGCAVHQVGVHQIALQRNKSERSLFETKTSSSATHQERHEYKTDRSAQNNGCQTWYIPRDRSIVSCPTQPKRTDNE